MPSTTPQILIEESKKIGQQSASQTLKAIAKAYPGKLFCTLSLVALENALLLAYPLFAGFAVDSILRGDASSALFYAAVVMAFWVVGAARRALDTRTFTRIYADLHPIASAMHVNPRILPLGCSGFRATSPILRRSVIIVPGGPLRIVAWLTWSGRERSSHGY